jgi:hypothetical protein
MTNLTKATLGFIAFLFISFIIFISITAPESRERRLQRLRTEAYYAVRAPKEHTEVSLPKPTPMERTLLQLLKTDKGTIRIGDSWDDSLPKLNLFQRRMEPMRIDKDSFIEYRTGKNSNLYFYFVRTIDIPHYVIYRIEKEDFSS